MGQAKLMQAPLPCLAACSIPAELCISSKSDKRESQNELLRMPSAHSFVLLSSVHSFAAVLCRTHCVKQARQPFRVQALARMW